MGLILVLALVPVCCDALPLWPPPPLSLALVPVLVSVAL